MRSEDYPLLQALTTRPLRASCARRLRQEGVSEAQAERGAETVERALAEEGPLTRPQLRERLDSAGVPTANQALVHVLFLVALRGIAVRGPVVGSEQAYVLVHDWLGPQPRIERDAALAELARRYLAGHWPASDRDLARWAGIGLREARAGLGAIGRELEQGDDGLLRPARRPPVAELPPPRLLGAFDPVLLGWTSREQIVGPHAVLVTRNGVFRPFAMAGGRAVARWRYARGRVEIDPLQRIPAKTRAALDADAEDVVRFLGPG